MTKKVEITEEELLASNQLRHTVAKILAHPKASVLVEQALKEVDPNAKTPRLDAAQQQEALLKPALDRVAALEQKIEEDKAARVQAETLGALSKKVEEGISTLRGQGWTDAGIAGVKKIMEDKGITDPLDAAAIFEKQNPPQAPITPGGQGAWNFMAPVADDGEDVKKLIESKGENDVLVTKMAQEALNEIRGHPRR